MPVVVVRSVGRLTDASHVRQHRAEHCAPAIGEAECAADIAIDQALYDDTRNEAMAAGAIGLHSARLSPAWQRMTELPMSPPKARAAIDTRE